MNSDLLLKLLKHNKEDIRLFSDIHGKKFAMIHQDHYEIDDNNLEGIFVIEADTLKPVAELNYCYSNYTGYNFVFLNLIQIDEPKYFSCGIGSYLIKFFEELVAKKLVFRVEGKFYPQKPATKEEVAKFYFKNGYQITREEHLEIGKNIDPENIKKMQKNSWKDLRGFVHYGSLKKMPNEQIEQDTLSL